ncbi:recombination protein RecR [candidate division KSB1 bacterium]|nr:recombination protein RecR [candidate division KSB1 bacterium]
MTESLEQLVFEFSKLPGIGRRTAQRLTFHLLKKPREEVAALAQALLNIKDKVRYCNVCFAISDSDPCSICRNPKRDQTTVCVVEDSEDLEAVERTGGYEGVYHVLGGVLSPLDGVGPDDLKVKELLSRLDGVVQEVILALNPTADGDTTSLYLSKLATAKGVKITRLARGISVGGDLEFTDTVTLARALEDRVEM